MAREDPKAEPVTWPTVDGKETEAACIGIGSVGIHPEAWAGGMPMGATGAYAGAEPAAVIAMAAEATAASPKHDWLCDDTCEGADAHCNAAGTCPDAGAGAIVDGNIAGAVAGRVGVACMAGMPCMACMASVACVAGAECMAGTACASGMAGMTAGAAGILAGDSAGAAV